MDGCHCEQSIMDSVFSKVLFGGRSKNPAQKCPATLSMLKEELATQEAALQEIFDGFLHQNFSEGTLSVLDSNRAEMPHEKITQICNSGMPKTYIHGEG